MGEGPTREQEVNSRYSDILSRAPEAVEGRAVQVETLSRIVQDIQKNGMLSDVATRIEHDGKGSVVRDSQNNVKQLIFKPELKNWALYGNVTVDIKDSGQITVNGKNDTQLKEDSDKFSKDFVSALVDSKERPIPMDEAVPLAPEQKEILKSLETSLVTGDLQSVSKLMKEHPDSAFWQRLKKEVGQDLGRGINLDILYADFSVEKGRLNFKHDSAFDADKIPGISIQTQQQDRILLSRSGAAASSRIPDGGWHESPRIVRQLDLSKPLDADSSRILDKIVGAGRSYLDLDSRNFRIDWYDSHKSWANGFRVPSMQAIIDAHNISKKELDKR